MTDLHWLTIAEASNLIKQRKLSPVEYVEALYARSERYDGRFNSYLCVTRESALREAEQAEQEIAVGDDRGPLHGVPYGLKDIIDCAGIPTTAHSKILAGNVPVRDAAVTARLKQAGGVLLGKLATHEFAIGGPSFDLPWPPARNPWNRDYFTGGSSSGSGAAVAAGFMPAAIGTDTGGSVRNPAGLCGLVGMKPTYGLVSRSGVLPLAFSLDTIGPLTRTVEDNALVLNAIAGHDPDDAGSVRLEPTDFTADLRAGVKGIRIGVIRHFYTRDAEAHPEVAAGVEEAVCILEDLGAETREVELQPLDVFQACNRNIQLAEAYSIHEQWLRERPGDYGDSTRRRLLPGAFIRGVDYVHATRLRSRFVREFNETMRNFDVLVTVSNMDLTPRIEDPTEVERTYPRQARSPFNLLGCPTLSVPVGFSADGLPLSMQIAGRAFDEATVYRVAYAYEQATDWVTRRPPIE